MTNIEERNKVAAKQMQERHKHKMNTTNITMSLRDLVLFCSVREAFKYDVESAGDSISDDQVVQYLCQAIEVTTKLDDKSKLVREIPRFIAAQEDEDHFNFLVKEWLERFEDGK